MKRFLAEHFNISGKISQSLHGEDIMLWRYFKNVKDGFFIDVGAYLPKLFNNTWRLRKKLGFKGINIEPTNRINYFNLFRRDDINLKCAVGKENKMIDFYLSDQPASSGKLAEGKKITVPQLTLSLIVEEYQVKKINLLDIDVEGTEMEVLEGYDWGVMPSLILIEDDKDTLNKIYNYLTPAYRLIGKTPLNSLYELKKR